MPEQILSGKFPTAGRPRNSHIFERARNDLYVEPSWCSERLFAVETFPPPIWDPCGGTDTIPRSARAAGLEARGTDISAGCDFLLITPVCDPPVFSIVTNPPYDPFTDCSGRDVRFIARPPPRSVRAAFPHTAPTSGV